MAFDPNIGKIRTLVSSDRSEATLFNPSFAFSCFLLRGFGIRHYVSVAGYWGLQSTDSHPSQPLSMFV